jgi:perosamine synthetase
MHALQQSFESGDWGSYHGAAIPKLESALSTLHRDRWVQTCSSGTVAVELALRSFSIEPGDKVVIGGYDFPGNFAAIEAIQATPVLVDVDPVTWAVKPEMLARAFAEHAPRAAIVSHLHGGLAPMRDIMELAKRFHVDIVEDFCQCPGAVVDGQSVGTWGDVSVTSFGGSKLLTAGRGGAIFGADPIYAQRIRIHNDRGNLRYPLSELQAAVLLPQLDSLADRNLTRQRQVDRLFRGVGQIEGLDPVDVSTSAERSPAYYKLAFRCSDVGQWVGRLKAEGVAVDSGFRGFLRKVGRGRPACLASGDLEGTRLAVDQTMILHHPILLEDDRQIDKLIQCFLHCQ